MVASGQLRTPFAYCGAQFIGGWIVCKTGLDALEKRGVANKTCALFFLHSYQKGCVAVAFEVCAREVSGSNIGRGTDCPDTSLASHFLCSTCVEPRLFFSKSFPFNHSPITQSDSDSHSNVLLQLPSKHLSLRQYIRFSLDFAPRNSCRLSSVHPFVLSKQDINIWQDSRKASSIKSCEYLFIGQSLCHGF
jgi:hypothetical protein